MSDDAKRCSQRCSHLGPAMHHAMEDHNGAHGRAQETLSDSLSDMQLGPLGESQDRRERLKAARLQRSSFTKEAVSLIRRGSHRSDAHDADQVDRSVKTVKTVKMGVRLDSPSGNRHIDAEIYEEMQGLEDVKIRQLKLAASQLFRHLALRASHRLAEQELLRRKWGARSIEQQVLRKAIRVLKKRRSAAEDSSDSILRRCSDLLSSWLKNKTEAEKTRECCEQMAKDVAIYQQEILCLHKLLPESSAPSERVVGGDATAQGKGLQLEIGRQRCEQLHDTDLREVCPEQLEQFWMRIKESEAQVQDLEEEERVAAAMELLHLHEPKAVKVRMSGLKQSAIRDESHLHAEQTRSKSCWLRSLQRRSMWTQIRSVFWDCKDKATLRTEIQRTRPSSGGRSVAEPEALHVAPRRSKEIKKAAMSYKHVKTRTTPQTVAFLKKKATVPFLEVGLCYAVLRQKIGTFTDLWRPFLAQRVLGSAILRLPWARQSCYGKCRRPCFQKAHAVGMVRLSVPDAYDGRSDAVPL
eukprot:s2050_g3.t3